MVEGIIGSGKEFYYHHDYLASTVMITTERDSTGVEIAFQQDYAPYYLNNDSKEFIVEFISEEFGCIENEYKDKDVKGFMLEMFIIYKASTRTNYEVVKFRDLKSLDPQTYNFLISFIKPYISDTDEIKLKYTAEFLIKTKDPKIIQIIKQYSIGEFTEKQKKRFYDSTKQPSKGVILK